MKIKLGFSLFVSFCFFTLSAFANSVCVSRGSSSQEEIIQEIIQKNTELDGNVSLGAGGSFRGHDSPIRNNSIPEKLRNPVILNGSNYYPSEGGDELPQVLYVANVMHENQLYVAEIPINKVSEVQLQKQIMPVGLTGLLDDLSAHARVRFTFVDGRNRKPVRLVKQIQTRNGVVTVSDLAEPILIHALSLSPEGMTETYDIFAGAEGRYALGHFLQTDSVAMSAYEGDEEKRRMPELYPIGLDSSEKRNVLLEALVTGALDDRNCDSPPRYIQTYNTVTQNCISESIGILTRGSDFSPARCSDPPREIATLAALRIVPNSGGMQQSYRSQRDAGRILWLPSRIGCFVGDPDGSTMVELPDVTED